MYIVHSTPQNNCMAWKNPEGLIKQALIHLARTCGYTPCATLLGGLVADEATTLTPTQRHN